MAVESENGQVVQCHLRRNQALPVVGDRVRWQFESEKGGIILTIEPRQSLLIRGQGHSDKQPIAANINAIVIVMAPPPVFSEYLVDRYLAAAELLQIQPLIVLNKMDLLNEITQASVLTRLMAYQAIPYPVILSSIFAKEGLSQLSSYLDNKTAVLVGPSGVGKSSIIAALVQEEAIRIGDVSAKGAGKHTTTATRLYHLPAGTGSLIDSPGVREFNLWPVTKKEILHSFKEFQPFLGQCKFRDCWHLIEPGCAVQDAILHDKISAKRYESYQTLMKTAYQPDFSAKKKLKSTKK
ncbi:MAG: ribosome small subunit-dependent GTPase A [Gammaproteobacteria bacterium]|nr:ribosome small subunit-dependent GTPase A [Gammaproteobacteria bacterium]